MQNYLSILYALIISKLNIFEQKPTMFHNGLPKHLNTYATNSGHLCNNLSASCRFTEGQNVEISSFTHKQFCGDLLTIRILIVFPNIEA